QKGTPYHWLGFNPPRSAPRRRSSGWFCHRRAQLDEIATLKTRLYRNTFYNLLRAFDNRSEITQTHGRALNSPYWDEALGGSAELTLRPSARERLSVSAQMRSDRHKEAQTSFPSGATEPVQTDLEDTYSLAAENEYQVITARSHLVEARVRLDNMICGLCATFGYRPGAGQGKAFLEKIMQAAHIPDLSDAIAYLLSVRAELMEQIKEMDRRLRVIASQSQAREILMTIPRIGVQTSAASAAAVDEARRFRQSRNAGAYFGLVPRRHQSGELDRAGRITKQGDGTVRKLLYEAANSILTRSRETFALKT
ncbi:MULTISPECIES: transposase, partial [unclassified Novosphingobium]|uniref:transposase n=1 Tax=unclassified Novosphingobium TaxID=2644732 RepID=UPI000D4DCCFC